MLCKKTSEKQRQKTWKNKKRLKDDKNVNLVSLEAH